MSSKTISSTRPLYIFIILSFSQTKLSQMVSVALKNTYSDQGWRNRLGSHQFCRHPRIWPCSISNRFYVMYKSPVRYPIVFCRYCCAYQHLQWPIWPTDSYLKIIYLWPKSIFLVFHYNRNHLYMPPSCINTRVIPKSLHTCIWDKPHQPKKPYCHGCRGSFGLLIGFYIWAGRVIDMPREPDGRAG